MKLFRYIGLAAFAGLMMFGAAAAAAHPQISKGKVLVILSSQHVLPLTKGQTLQTGYYLNEFGVPADKLLKAGYTLVLANPKGNTPVVDPGSLEPHFFGGSKAEMQRIYAEMKALPGYQHPETFRQVLAGDMSQYKAVFIPGGHAPMIDLANNPELGQILTYFHKAGKPTATICHGPVSLMSALPDQKAYIAAYNAGKTPKAKGWIYAGYHMTVFSTAEEKAYNKTLGARVLFYPQQAMGNAGGQMSEGPLWKSHVVSDRELITGQNPSSDVELAKVLLQKLAGK